MFDPDNSLNVEGVREYKDGDDLPGNAVVVSNWAAIGLPPFDSAVMRHNEGVLYWHDPRTVDERASDARADRDRRMDATIGVTLKAFRTGQPIPADWAAYMQALADVPQQAEFPDAIAWPTPPDD